MTNKELQRQRMRGYFIDAAIELIDNEGVEAVSARRVAELAGYSYATIYNYFTDIKHLLWHCLPIYIERINQQLQPERMPGPTGLDKLRQSVRAYAKFFVDYPHSFRFIFLTELGDTPEELISTMEKPTFNETLMRILQECVAEGVLTPEQASALIGMIGFTVNGALLFYLNNRLDVDEEEFFIMLDKALDPALNYGGK
ncbi:MAG: TetR/AcrR family transcriptional regulator [Firmicutes bacterium]|nr:TetR/AcrR family transcriptional regulator [Bacillota bacterium]